MPISEMALQLSISQAAFLGVASLIFQRHTYIGKLLIAFSVCMLGYLFYHQYYYDSLGSNDFLPYFLGRLSYGIPGIIWLFAYALFEHEKKVPKFVWLVIATYFVLKAVGVAYYPWEGEHEAGDALYVLFYIIPQIINTGMYLHTLSLAISEYQQDLIEARRNLRVYFVAVLGSFWLLVSVQVSVSVLMRMGLAQDLLEDAYELVNNALSILIFPVGLAVNLMLFNVRSLSFGLSEERLVNGSAESPRTEKIDPKDLQLRDALLHAMDEDKLYCQTGLTIGKLAKQMNAQEYRLRSVINRVLGYNNFSGFLNKYRIKEAEARLINTSDSIFNIGLDVGYTSLSSFHKAFKEAHGITPKEFRVLSRHAE
ncbi:MAG: helix-turn-helix transcriptional regulator [Pseudohongiellaceae bacterium]